jgi:hypothetical protein
MVAAIALGVGGGDTPILQKCCVLSRKRRF